MIVIRWETTKSYTLQIQDQLAADLFGVPADNIIGSLEDMDDDDIADKLAQYEGPTSKADRSITDWRQE